MLAFAEDIVIYAESEIYLQTSIKCIANWCKKWRMKENTEYTNVVHFRNRMSKTVFEFMCDNTVFNIVDKYKT